MSDPQAAPPAQPLQFLAQMLAEMATMSRDQAADQRAHLAALREQTDRQTQVLERLVGAAAPPKPSPLSVAVPRMGDGDDPQVFLETFRATAEACQWPREEWAPRLLPLLSGEAQTAALSLPPASRSSFADVSRAVVDRLGLTAEDHRRRFRACRLATTDRPFAWARQLRDAAVRWLQPGTSEGETKLVDKVVLEQFTEGLPAETARWVRCHRPASLEVAVTLAEDHLAAGAGEPGDAGRRPNKQAPVPAPRRRVPAPGQAERLPALSPTNPALVPSRAAEPSGAAPEPRRAAQTPGPECWKCGQPGHLRRDCPLMEVGQVFRVAGAPAPSPGPGGTYSIPVRTRGGIRQALVDTGCTQTLVHQSLVRPGALLEAEWVEVRCVHGDVHRYPIVPLLLKYKGKTHRVTAAVSPRLSHPLILGTNWPGFHQLLGQYAGVRSRPEAGCSVCAAFSGDAGSSDTDSGGEEPAGPSRDVPPAPKVSPMGDFPLEQSRDGTLRSAFDQVMAIDGHVVRPEAAQTYPRFVLLNDRLYRVSRDTQTEETHTQLLVPQGRRETLFQAAHYNPMAGHMGYEKTLERITARFYWPGIRADVRRWCASCLDCQLVNQPAIPKAPLRPLPLIEVPFERIGMDLIGPFHRSARGYRFVLVLVDYATRYPEAVPLRTISAKSVAQALFAVREVPQASTGFSPFELLFGRRPRGVLDLIKESWEDGPSPAKNGIQYVLDLRAKLHTLGRLSRENLLQAQQRQQRLYDRGARLRQFSPGDKVLVLLPTSSSKLLAKWQGPFVVTRRVGDVDYEVARSDRGGATQIYHLNLLKLWREVETASLVSLVKERDELGPEVPNSIIPASLPCDDHLTQAQRADVVALQQRFADVFSPLPGRTSLIEHHFVTQPGVTVRSRPYRLPEHKRKIVQRELAEMLRMGVIEESHSAWCSPIVLVAKKDGSIQFCVDYRRVNEVSRFDAYPMPRVDELLDRLGTARFFTTLDLTKGYWQIPLSAEAREKTAFSTPYGLYQFVTLPFGLFGAPATFQRLMDRVLRPHAAYAAAYLDDVIIHSDTWAEHVLRVAAVLESLRGAGLTANPKKCAVGRREVQYLGYHLGGGQVRPQVEKTAAIASCPRPRTKKEVRRFLGLAGYYRRFVPGFAQLTSPLTDLTQKGAPDLVQWTGPCQAAFVQVKKALCGEPLLHTPNFSLPFVLQTDASDRGLGAVLSQQVRGADRPVLYISRKLAERERRYSTVEKECLAIRWAVGSLRYYLLGRSFTLCSDHAPLQWLHRMKDANARITRWYLALQPFKFKVIHRPGAQMAVADFLSRSRGGELARPDGSPASNGRWGCVAEAWPRAQLQGRSGAEGSSGRRCEAGKNS
ncbi:uncharacterized protein LOC113009615 [Astatotilapia calliptera]|uniref:uncharacterized protein LOC113009615 n=1 Tax=Astatotilapia calliptera TaxID=8154 RepID=UPI000E3FC6AB|nr:uncharacterized protein LOC113009615 [Astatotilapia calliptera]